MNVEANKRLLIAANKGTVEEVRELLEIDAGVDINFKGGYNNRSPLYVAVSSGNKEIAELLISKGADVNAKDKDGRTSLHSAASSGNKEIAELLISKGADVNAQSNNGWTPLHSAASNGSKEIAELLIANDADVNAPNKDGDFPLRLAIIIGRSKEVEDLLISKGGVRRAPLKPFPDEVAASIASGESNPVQWKFIMDEIISPEVSSVEELYTKVRKHFKKQTYESGGYSFILDYQKLSVGDFIIFDGMPEALWCQEDSKKSGDCTIFQEFTLRSLVGPVVSYEVTSMFSGAGGPVYVTEEYSAVDITNKKPANLLELVEEQSLVKAIPSSSWFGEQWRGDKKEYEEFIGSLESAQNWAEIQDIWTKSYPNSIDEKPEGLLRQFVVSGYDQEKDSVSIVFGIDTLSIGITEISVLVKPKDNFRNALLETLNGKGFF